MLTAEKKAEERHKEVLDTLKNQHEEVITTITEKGNGLVDYYSNSGLKKMLLKFV
jgi:hypothetical protein